jgi:hypothetical protein
VVAPRQCRGRALRTRALCVAQTSLDPRALERLQQLNPRHALPKVAAPARVAGGEGGGQCLGALGNGWRARKGSDGGAARGGKVRLRGAGSEWTVRL